MFSTSKNSILNLSPFSASLCIEITTGFAETLQIIYPIVLSFLFFLLGEIVPEGGALVGGIFAKLREIVPDDKTRDVKEKLFSSTTGLCHNPLC